MPTLKLYADVETNDDITFEDHLGKGVLIETIPTQGDESGSSFLISNDDLPYLIEFLKCYYDRIKKAE